MKLEEIIDKVGQDRFQEFLNFMGGQTVGINEDGSIDYFEQDVENFLRPKHKRFFD